MIETTAVVHSARCVGVKVLEAHWFSQPLCKNFGVGGIVHNQM